MKRAVILTVLLAGSPLCAQEARVWTNADLGRPLSPTRRTVTPEELASLATHQFVYVPPLRETEPWLMILGSSPTAGPFGEFASFGPTRSLDGYAYAEPWFMSTYLRRGRGGHGRWGFGNRAPCSPVELTPALPTVPTPAPAVHLSSPPARAAGRPMPSEPRPSSALAPL